MNVAAISFASRFAISGSVDLTSIFKMLELPTRVTPIAFRKSSTGIPSVF
jgi:hypothetical protein